MVVEHFYVYFGDPNCIYILDNYLVEKTDSQALLKTLPTIATIGGVITNITKCRPNVT